nr:hypothetical protein [Candidatus Cloacimonadota bacterium]
FSTNYYSMAEIALEANDFDTAINLFKRAVAADPQSVYIKERLIETLAVSCYVNQKDTREMTELGEKYFAEGNYTVKMLQLIADAYRIQENYLRADFFYKTALEKEVSMRSLSLYYVFQKKYFPPADEKMLYKALKLPWKQEEDVLMLAGIIGEIDAEKGMDVLTKAYQKWDDEQTLKTLLSAYDKAGQKDKVLQIIQERLDEGKTVSDGLISFLVGKYFTGKQWDKVIENREYIYRVGTEDILKLLFFAAINNKDYEVGKKAGTLLEELGEIQSEMKASFYTYLAKLYFDSGDFPGTVAILAKSNKLEMIRDFVFDYDFEHDEVLQQNLIDVLQRYEELTNNSNVVKYVLAMMYTALYEGTEALDTLDKISPDFLVENDMNLGAATLWLQNSHDIDRAIEFIDLVPDSVYSSLEIASAILYATNQDSLSYAVCMRDFYENPQPALVTFLRYSMLAEKYDTYENLKKILLSAIELYPDNADLKNALGYIIAKSKYRDDFTLAYELLQDAVKLKSDSEMIWDSLAWLYFVDGQPGKALESMNVPLSNPIENSEIAYHLGAIYLALNIQDEAQKYLKMAVDINDDEDSVRLSEELLEEINVGDKK